MRTAACAVGLDFFSFICLYSLLQSWQTFASLVALPRQSLGFGRIFGV